MSHKGKVYNISSLLGDDYAWDSKAISLPLTGKSGFPYKITSLNTVIAIIFILFFCMAQWYSV